MQHQDLELSPLVLAITDKLCAGHKLSMDPKVTARALGNRFQTSVTQLNRLKDVPSQPSQPMKRQITHPKDFAFPLTRVKTMDFAELKPRFLLGKSSPWVKAFRRSVNFILLYSVLSSLFFLGYRKPTDSVLWIDRGFQVIFTIEIGLFFFTSRKDEAGLVVISKRLIALEYLKSWLVFDVLAVFPFREIGYEDLGYILRLSRVLKLALIVKILDKRMVISAIRTCKGSRFAPQIVRVSFYIRTIGGLAETFFFLGLLTYTISCLFIWYSRMIEEYVEDSFWINYGLNQNSNFPEVLKSMYFILATLSSIGYGDYYAQNVYERAFMIPVLIIGVVAFSIFAGQLYVGLVEYQYNTNCEAFFDLMATWFSNLETRFGKLPLDLKARILSHFEYYRNLDRLKALRKCYWNCHSYADMVKDKGEYVDLLPEQTIHAVFDSLFADVFYRFRSFFTSSDFKYAVIPHFQPRRFPVGEEILEEDSIVQELLFIMEGSVLCGVKTLSKLRSILLYPDGWTLLGDFEILTETKTVATYVTSGSKPVLAYAVPRKALLMILDQGFPDTKLQLVERARKRHNELKKLMSGLSISQTLQMTPVQSFIAAVLIHSLSQLKPYHRLAESLHKRFLGTSHLPTSQSDVESTQADIYDEQDSEMTENQYVRSNQLRNMLHEYQKITIALHFQGQETERGKKLMEEKMTDMKKALRKMKMELNQGKENTE